MSEDKKKKKGQTTSNQELEELKTKCQDYLNGWQRAQADYDNLKKETEKRVSDLREYIQAGLILDILPVLDHYKMALKHIPEADAEKDWVKGFQHIKKDFTEFLKQYNLVEIKTIGEQFNPEFHEAVGQEVAEVPDNQIIKEVSPGYMMNEGVIRPAKVIVSINNKESQSNEADISDRKE